MVAAASMTHVTPSTKAEGVLCPCSGVMNPMLYRSNRDDEDFHPEYERWLFWRCSLNPDHVSAAVPLGHLRICA